MAKFGLYTKNTSESSGRVHAVDMPSAAHAEAYFAGTKQLTLEQFRNMFIVREIKNDSRNLLLG
jgi:hypothetical protein